jgi:hypothetical protein
MSALPPPHTDSARLERALDRLAAHCELAALRSEQFEQRRVSVQARLEQELGAELASRLLTGLTPAA